MDAVWEAYIDAFSVSDANWWMMFIPIAGRNLLVLRGDACDLMASENLRDIPVYNREARCNTDSECSGMIPRVLNSHS